MSHHRMILQAVYNAIYIYLYTESMTENSGSLAVQLAEATISEAQRADRWQVGYSERERPRPYFLNVALGRTQRESLLISTSDSTQTVGEEWNQAESR